MTPSERKYAKWAGRQPRRPALVREDLHVRVAAVVIDGDVHEVATDRDVALVEVPRDLVEAPAALRRREYARSCFTSMCSRSRQGGGC